MPQSSTAAILPNSRASPAWPNATPVGMMDSFTPGWHLRTAAVIGQAKLLERLDIEESAVDEKRSGGGRSHHQGANRLSQRQRSDGLAFAADQVPALHDPAIQQYDEQLVHAGREPNGAFRQ